MISVNRTSVSPPKDLVGDDCPGAKELAKALAFYARPENSTASYGKYKAYKNESVIKALNELFHGKCAYCESAYNATQPVDVEHYRPKGAIIIKDALTPPGYYWLAATWENLLPSCIDCNRERTQEFPDRRTGKVGKANKFPLRGRKKHASRPGHERREHAHRLLLNPCEDLPHKHIEFTEEGVVRPALKASGQPSDMGEISIEVYGLQRIGLVQRRMAHAKTVCALIKSIKLLERKVVEYPNDQDFVERLKEEMGLLKGFMQPDREYAGMVQQIVAKLYRELPR